MARCTIWLAATIAGGDGSRDGSCSICHLPNKAPPNPRGSTQRLGERRGGSDACKTWLQLRLRERYPISYKMKKGVLAY